MISYFFEINQVSNFCLVTAYQNDEGLSTELGQAPNSKAKLLGEMS